MMCIEPWFPSPVLQNLPWSQKVSLRRWHLSRPDWSEESLQVKTQKESIPCSRAHTTSEGLKLLQARVWGWLELARGLDKKIKSGETGDGWVLWFWRLIRNEDLVLILRLLLVRKVCQRDKHQGKEERHLVYVLWGFSRNIELGIGDKPSCREHTLQWSEAPA